MKKFPLIAAVAWCFLCNPSAVPVNAQCSNGSCLVPTRQPVEYEWRLRDGDPERRYLYRNNVCIGAYDVEHDYYRPYDAEAQTWGDCCQPPWKTPTAAGTKAWQSPTHNYGVDTSKLGNQEKYTLHTTAGSRQLSKDAAQGLVGASLPDDSQKLRVTVIGPEDKQKQVLADLGRLGPDLSIWAVTRAYAPEHWSVQPGFVKTGSPTIYCQAPSGKVLHRQDDYEGGGEALVEALRKAKATYDPKKDPDLRVANQDTDVSKTATWGLALALGAGLCQFLQRRKAGGQ